MRQLEPTSIREPTPGSEMAGPLPRTTRRPRRDEPEAVFREGKEAAATLVRALAVPDQATQLAIAQLLIETRRRVPSVIEKAKLAASAAEH